MALSFLVRLRYGRYDAALDRREHPEWPPHPARLFSALVASAVDEADWSALRWLERAGEPEVWASPVAGVSRAVGFVVINAVARKGDSQFWPGRTNRRKERSSALPAHDSFAVVWPDVTPDDATLGRLLRLARRVPYLGRSTSPAEVSVWPELPDAQDGWAAFRPVRLGSPGAVSLRVPFPGYVDALRDAYQEGRRAHEVRWMVEYATGGEEPPASQVEPARPYPELLVFGVARPRVPISGDRFLRVTRALRLAVMSRIPDPLPPAVSGHEADGVPHLGYLGLLDVGHEHADGHLLGVAVALPADLPGSDRRTVLRALVKEPHPLRRLRIARHAEVDLEYQPDRVRPWGLLPERWSGPSGGSTSWVTATPLMLDKHPRRSLTEADVIAQSLVTAGYPEPRDVEVLPGSPVAGGIRGLSRGVIPDGRPRRPVRHCRVEFPQPVVGPVFAGSLRYLGCGLMVPPRRTNIDPVTGG